MPASPEARQRLLILGGTTEAADLAARLDGDDRFDVTSSLAGVTRRPAPLAGMVRRGGFGGPDGLTAYLRDERFDRVVDATHPFARKISIHAAAACRELGIPLLRLERPAWQRHADDHWIEVTDMAAAAALLPTLGQRVFLTGGRKDLASFAALDGIWFLVRLIEAPAEPLPLDRHQLILARGPFEIDDELRLLRQHKIDAIVAKNSGGAATYAKIGAARVLGLPVVMITRPTRIADATSVTDVAGALAWLGL